VFQNEIIESLKNMPLYDIMERQPESKKVPYQLNMRNLEELSILHDELKE
jgi:hypothetical protein